MSGPEPARPAAASPTAPGRRQAPPGRAAGASGPSRRGGGGQPAGSTSAPRAGPRGRSPGGSAPLGASGPPRGRARAAGARIALAVMAKVPVAGAVKTRLCPPLSPVEAAQLARCFLQDRIAQVRRVAEADPIVAFAPAERGIGLAGLVPPGLRLVPQRGPDLGARLDRLLTDLLAEGYAGAVAVDADSPTLPVAFLRAACRMLGRGRADVVVGPCEDGGYYLIGLRAPAPGLFTAMPWSTPAVLGETIARARRLGLRLALLPRWFDVDRGEDLARLRASLGTGAAFRPPRTLAFLRRWTGRPG
jgi:rSAM/selenodomain-associated transferase 1